MRSDFLTKKNKSFCRLPHQTAPGQERSQKIEDEDLTKNATQGSINQQIFPLIPAEVLQISQALVKTRLLRARLKIRDALAPGLDGAWSTGDGSWKKVRPW